MASDPEIVSVLPGELVIQPLSSVDDKIVSKRLVEILPRESGSYFGSQENTAFASTTLTDRLTFYVQSPTAFMNCQNSFIHGEFEAVVKNSSDAEYDAFLDEGGIHACIKSIIVKIGSAVVERIEDYSKLYNAVKFATVSDATIDSCDIFSLDSSADYRYIVPNANYSNTLSDAQLLTSTAVSATDAGADGSVVTITGGAATTELEIGDEVLIEDQKGATVSAHNSVVVSITNDTTFTIKPSIGAAIASDAANRVYKVNKFDKFEKRSMRNIAVNGIPRQGSQTLRFMFKPMLNSLMMLQYFPLALLSAPLEIQIEFNPARLALVKRSGSSSSSDKVGYKITRPRFVAEMVEVDETTMDKYVKVWENGTIDLPFHSWRRYNNRVASSNQSAQLQFQTNLASVHGALTLLTPESTCDADGWAASIVKSQATFKKYDLKDYRYSSGSLKFPDYGVVQCDVLSPQAFAQLQLLFNNMGNAQFNNAINTDEWVEGVYDAAGVDTTYTPSKFLLCASMSKYSGGYLSGVDLSRSQLELELNFNSSLSENVSVKTYLLYDCTLRLSRKNGAIVLS